MIINGFPVSGGVDTIDISTATVTLVSSSLTYDGQPKTQQVQSVVLDGNTLVAGTDYVVSGNVQINAGTYSLTVVGVRDYSGSVSASWSIAKATGSVTLSENSIELNSVGETATIEVTSNSGGTVSAVSSDAEVAIVSVSGNVVTVTSVSMGTATITVTVSDTANYTSVSATCLCECIYFRIYGVEWDKTSTSLLTRTDESANFTDPVPCLSGGTGSSPFDNRMPWSGMVKETFTDGNVMVKIPKFWYKWTDETNSLKLQISDAPLEGFFVSPAHADRSDGKGERDYVYVGRYHCDNYYKSTSGASPITNMTRASARSGCTELGTGYYQLDYAMLWTIRMLYLVEFADWNSQNAIGYGCGPGNNTAKYSGSSDSALYHTGTMKSSRTTYGFGIQYRYIEDPWGFVYDWCDGIALNSGAAYVTNNMSKYGDYAPYLTKVADAPTGDWNCITGWTVPSITGLEWALWPKSRITNSNYITDWIDDGSDYSDSYPCVYIGGNYTQTEQSGLFASKCCPSSSTQSYIGARLQYLP